LKKPPALAAPAASKLQPEGPPFRAIPKRAQGAETNMHEPIKKRKTQVNIYREKCRQFVASHPLLHPSHKFIIMRQTDYINQYTRDTFVGAETLAKDCNTTTRSVERAQRSARDLLIITQTQRGHRRGDGTAVASRYVFNLPQPDTFEESFEE